MNSSNLGNETHTDSEVPSCALQANKIEHIIEAALMSAGFPLTVANIQKLFSPEENVSPQEIKKILQKLKEQYQDRGIELKEVASGFRFQAKAEYSTWLAKLWEERAPRYSRAFLETLAIIAYKQPITRAEIEEIRGVTVSSTIMKTLTERDWVRVLGYKDLPGKPAIYGTTKTFLDYFNLKSLSSLPTLAEFKSLEAQESQLQVQLALENSDVPISDSESIPEENAVISLENFQHDNDEPEEILPQKKVNNAE